MTLFLPTQAKRVHLAKLYEEFKYEPSRIEVIFQLLDKADAFLDVLNDLKQSGSTIQPLFTDPGTMADTGFVKLIKEYDQKYHQIFEDNKEMLWKFLPLHQNLKIILNS